MIHKSPYPPVDIPEVLLTPLLLDRAKTFGSKIAFIDATNGKATTFSEFHETVLSTAYGLHRFGLEQGEVLAIYSPNCVEYAFAFHAVSLIGGIVTTVNPLCTAWELATQLNDSRAKFLLTVPQLLDKATEAASQSGVKHILILGRGSSETIPFSSLSTERGPLPERMTTPKDVVAMPYSSGTTGFPKGVMLTHRNLVANLLQVEASRIFQPNDVVVCVLPTFHIYGLMVIMNENLYLGNTNVVLPRFDLEQFLNVVQNYRVTTLPLVPPIVLALAKNPMANDFDLSSVRTIFSAAAPLGTGLIEECITRMGCVVKQGYGMTEASPATHMSPYEPEKLRDGTVGVCVPSTEYKLIDESGNALSPGEQGEVLVRGPQIMKGYLNRKKETDQAIDQEGWLRTGDIGFADEAGNLTIVDRVKELIKYKGFQVAPAELEALLITHPAVKDAAVIPSADLEAGEVPKAFVVLKEQIDLQELQDFVAMRVAPHKKIRKIETIDVIPKSPSGKILRRILVQKERSQ